VRIRIFSLAASTLVLALGLSACGGGGGGGGGGFGLFPSGGGTTTTPPPAADNRVAVSGIVATGAPASGSSVTLRCANGVSGAATTGTDDRTGNCRVGCFEIDPVGRSSADTAVPASKAAPPIKPAAPPVTRPQSRMFRHPLETQSRKSRTQRMQPMLRQRRCQRLSAVPCRQSGQRSTRHR